tara:strand:+ start:89 stop:571 length:483 start_codon:yes stop_codon:yes gene_type:complete
MTNLVEIVESYKKHSNIEMEFKLKNVTKEKFLAMKNMLISKNFPNNYFQVKDVYYENNIRVSELDVIKKTLIQTIHNDQWKFTVAEECPYICSSYMNELFTRTKQRTRFDDKFLYIDMTYVKETESYEVEIELNNYKIVLYNSKKIMSRCDQIISMLLQV